MQEGGVFVTSLVLYLCGTRYCLHLMYPMEKRIIADPPRWAVPIAMTHEGHILLGCILRVSSLRYRSASQPLWVTVPISVTHKEVSRTVSSRFTEKKVLQTSGHNIFNLVSLFVHKAQKCVGQLRVRSKFHGPV